jgi:hypothetical protein
MSYSSPTQLCFPPVGGQTVRADFEGGALSSDLVAYLLVADNVSGPLLTRLIDPSQPVIHTGNEFSRPRLALLASI